MKSNPRGLGDFVGPESFLSFCQTHFPGEPFS
jgi:hypothetical protein